MLEIKNLHVKLEEEDKAISLERQFRENLRNFS